MFSSSIYIYTVTSIIITLHHHYSNQLHHHKNRTFQDAKETREQDQDPTVRFNKFLKNAHKGTTASTTTSTNIEQQNSNYHPHYHSNGISTTTISGSFGGKPKTIRKNFKNNNVRKSQIIPAWIAASNGNDSKDEQHTG